MSQNTPQTDMATRRVVYAVPGMNDVKVRRDELYRATDTGPLTMDLYYPPNAKTGLRTPTVVFVTGFSDVGAQKMFGRPFKEMGSYISWAQLTAMSGVVAITYRNSDPAADVHAVLQHLWDNAAALGIDENRMGLWSCSANVPNALAVLMSGARDHLKCAALCYGYMLDVDGSSRVADVGKQFGFANPAAGKRVEDLPRDVPLFIARAGQDQTPGLNETLDRFVVKAFSANLPVTLANHPRGAHAFDLVDDSDTSRAIIRQTLTFLQIHL